MRDSCCSVLELRQYTLHPGKREVLVELFDREFALGQERSGMHVHGQFRDLDRSDRFVWLRGFRDMTARAAALKDFYAGPVWLRHREAANATMRDWSDVLLLRPVEPGSGFEHEGAPGVPGSLFGALILHPAAGEGFAAQVKPLLIAAGGRPLAWLRTEPAENNFPALPIRSGENVYVWFASFPEPTGGPMARLLASASLRSLLAAPPQLLRLEPTPRSRIR
jgi:NIPSNAP protein